MKLPIRLLALTAFAAASLPARAAVETYAIDPVHSSVAFSIRHIVSKVPGRFTDFAGTITIDRDHPEKSVAEASIKIASIDTHSQKRDNHLRSPDFFDAAKYPDMKFRSTSWKKTGDDSYEVRGDLTIKDVTKPVTLNVELLGVGPGMMPGSQVSGWEATTKINKAEFNVKDPPMLDAALGDDVDITINIEAGLKKA